MYISCLVVKTTYILSWLYRREALIVTRIFILSRPTQVTKFIIHKVIMYRDVTLFSKRSSNKLKYLKLEERE